jgi:hypothetical protein
MARSVSWMGSGVCDRAGAMHGQPGPGTMRAVSGQRDLPGYSSTQETEALGLLAVQAYLVRHGFKVTEVSGRFDDGLDLLVSPHDEASVLPAIAGIQVRSGPSHRGLKVGQHERYWREHNLPGFGVVLTELEAEPPRGGWCDAQTYLKAHPGARSIPTPHLFPFLTVSPQPCMRLGNGAGACWPPWTSSMPTGGAKPPQRRR